MLFNSRIIVGYTFIAYGPVLYSPPATIVSSPPFTYNLGKAELRVCKYGDSSPHSIVLSDVTFTNYVDHLRTLDRVALIETEGAVSVVQWRNHDQIYLSGKVCHGKF